MTEDCAIAHPPGGCLSIEYKLIDLNTLQKMYIKIKTKPIRTAVKTAV